MKHYEFHYNTKTFPGLYVISEWHEQNKKEGNIYVGDTWAAGMKIASNLGLRWIPREPDIDEEEPTTILGYFV